MDKPSVKIVEVVKRGRFWAVHADGELLALVLYKKGALAVRDLLMGLTSIAVNEPSTSAKSTTKNARAPRQPRPPADHPETGANAPSH